MHVNGQLRTRTIFLHCMDLPRADQLGDREGLYQANRAMANSLRNCQVARLKNYHSACGDSRTYRLNYIIHIYPAWPSHKAVKLHAIALQ